MNPAVKTSMPPMLFRKPAVLPCFSFLFEQKENSIVHCYMNSVLKPLMPLATVAFLIVAMSGLNAQTSTATTDIMGYSTVSLPSGGSALVPLFVIPSAYSASSSFDGTSNLSATGLTSGAFNPVNGFPVYYVEICSGNYTGFNYPVTSNTSSKIVASGLPSDLGATVSIKIRPYTTLATVSSGSSGLSDYSDSLTLYQASNQISSYVYALGGVLDGDGNPANGVPISPGMGLIVNNAGNATVTFIGEVNTNQCVVPLNAGTTLIGSLNPQGGQSVAAMNLAPALAPYSDTASLVAADGSLSITSFLSDGSNLLDGDGNIITGSNSPTVTAGNGFIVNSGQNGFWTNASVLSN